MEFYFKKRFVFRNLLLLLLLSTSHISISQTADFNYRDVSHLVPFPYYSQEMLDEFMAYPAIEDYLPSNYVEDGTRDYTSYVQQAINENQNVKFPDFPILINDTGIFLRSNSNLYFQPNSSLVMAPTDLGRYTVLTLNDLTNVNIYNPTLVGERDDHLGTGGEWGTGLRINGSSHINVYDVNIRDMWGDGIYVGNYRAVESDDVLIENGLIDNVRRNGISIISAKNLTINNIVIANTNGTNPASGIVIEPNTQQEILENIHLNNITTINGDKEGIVFNASRFLTPNLSKEVSISINSHYDDGSRIALRFFKKGFVEEDLPLSGYIAIKNSVYTNTRMHPVTIPNENYKLPTLYFDKVEVDTDAAERFRTLMIQKTQRFDNVKIVNL